MFVINYDFSEYHYLFKFIPISIPVVITEILTYPLQRIQTQLILRQNMITKNQFNQARLIFKQMIGVEKFPKFLHGSRHSVDYSVTQMISKFYVFDWLMDLTMKQDQSIIISQNGQVTIQLPQQDSFQNMKSKMTVYARCIVANGFATFFSQSAFNYQILASSLPVDAKNRSQDVKQKLLQYTKNRKNIPLLGLKYTIPVSIYNTVLQVFLIEKLTKILKINQDPAKNYFLQEISTAVSAFFLTGFAYHFSYLRQAQLVMKLELNSLPYTKGLLATMIRHVSRWTTLYGLYFLWFEHQSKQQISQMYERRESSIDKLPTYRK